MVKRSLKRVARFNFHRDEKTSKSQRSGNRRINSYRKPRTNNIMKLTSPKKKLDPKVHLKETPNHQCKTVKDSNQYRNWKRSDGETPNGREADKEGAVYFQTTPKRKIPKNITRTTRRTATAL